MFWVVIVVVGLIALIGRLFHIWIRYRRIKAAGYDVRWEWPLARWWRNVRSGRSATER